MVLNGAVMACFTGGEEACPATRQHERGLADGVSSLIVAGQGTMPPPLDVGEGADRSTYQKIA